MLRVYLESTNMEEICRAMEEFLTEIPVAVFVNATVDAMIPAPYTTYDWYCSIYIKDVNKEKDDIDVDEIITMAKELMAIHRLHYIAVSRIMTINGDEHLYLSPGAPSCIEL